MKLGLHSYVDSLVTTEEDLMREHLPTEEGAVWVELGCGAAKCAQSLAKDLKNVRFRCYEVDEKQLQKNLALPSCPENLSFGMAGMQNFPADNESVDAVVMLKSLHHVPKEFLKPGFERIRSALKVGGKLFICEPVFTGDFNEILRLFHDEEEVRSNAFDALKSQVEEESFELEKELHFQVLSKFPRGFADFEERVIGSTFNHFQLSDTVLEMVKERFQKHVKEDGSAQFYMPMRLDLLVKKKQNLDTKWEEEHTRKGLDA